MIMGQQEVQISGNEDKLHFQKKKTKFHQHWDVWRITYVPYGSSLSR